MHEKHANRFWEKVDKSGGPDACWPWLAGCTPDGYGKFKIEGKTRRAHAVALEIGTEEAANGRHALHNCDTPLCCNQLHLFWGSNADNMADKTAKGRQSKGENHGRAVLTYEQVAAARKRFTPRHPDNGIAAMAREFGVSRAAMSYAVNGQHWGSK